MMGKIFPLKCWLAVVGSLLFLALSLGWVYAQTVRPIDDRGVDAGLESSSEFAPKQPSDPISSNHGAAIPNYDPVIPSFTITVQACQDSTLNGCEPGEFVPPPLGVSACLEGPGLPANNCQSITNQAGFVFTNLVTGAYTASLRLSPALLAEKYELTSPQMVTVTLTGCQCDIGCTSPACESKCHCNCEATVKLGIIKEGVEVAKADHPDPVIAGGILTYTITATNTGITNITDMFITDTLDSQVSFRSASDGGQHDGQSADGVVTWTAGILPPGPPITRTLSVTVGNNLIPPCVITNTASVIFKDGSGAYGDDDHNHYDDGAAWYHPQRL